MLIVLFFLPPFLELIRISMLKYYYITVLLIIGNGLFAQDRYEALLESGNDKMRNGNTLGAIKDYTEAIEIDNQRVWAYLGRGSVYAELENYDQALVDLNMAIKIDSTIADAYYNRAYIYCSKGYKALCIKDYEKYLEMKPNDFQARIVLVEMLSDNDKKQKHLEIIKKIELSSPQELIQRAALFYNSGDTLNAIKDLKKSIKENAQMWDAYYLLAEIYKSRNQVNLAIENYNLYLLENQSFEALVGRGQAYATMKNWISAIDDYQRAIDINQNSYLFFDVGFFYLKLDDFEKAKPYFVKAIEMGYNDIELAYYNKGICEINLKNKKQACTDWKQAGSFGQEALQKYCK